MNQQTTAFIALIGCPNVGKSSLLNRLVGEKVAIVSDKPQTTRNRVLGVCTKDECQLVLMDTPGAHQPRTQLGSFMMKTVGRTLDDVDAAVLVVQAGESIREQEQRLLQRLQRNKLPALLLINKIDTLEDKRALLPCISMWQQAYPFDDIIPVSVLEGDGMDTVLQKLQGYAQPAPHFFPDDAVTDQPERVLAAELVREQMLNLLDQEVPHGVAVTVERFAEREDAAEPMIDIDVVILCERDGHKGIIIGKGGKMLKTIGTRARKQMEELFGAKVNLQCWVKVKEDWRNRGGLLHTLGFTEKN